MQVEWALQVLKLQEDEANTHGQTTTVTIKYRYEQLFIQGYSELSGYICREKNGLFHLISLPPPMDDFSVSVPGGIDTLGYLCILL